VQMCTSFLQEQKKWAFISNADLEIQKHVTVSFSDVRPPATNTWWSVGLVAPAPGINIGKGKATLRETFAL
jgi:hypothetical protein